MSKSFLTKGNRFNISCDNRFLICDPASPTQLCCLTCGDLNVSILVPRGNLLITIDNVVNLAPAGCGTCTNVNTDHEVDLLVDDPCMWQSTYSIDWGVGCDNPSSTYTVSFSLLCCNDDDFVYVFVNFTIQTLVHTIDMYKLVATFPNEPGCRFYDLTEDLPLSDFDFDPDPCSFNEFNPATAIDCDWSGMTLVVDEA